jgi:hypothetical protein
VTAYRKWRRFELAGWIGFFGSGLVIWLVGPYLPELVFAAIAICCGIAILAVLIAFLGEFAARHCIACGKVVYVSPGRMTNPWTRTCLNCGSPP